LFHGTPQFCEAWAGIKKNPVPKNTGFHENPGPEKIKVHCRFPRSVGGRERVGGGARATARVLFLGQGVDGGAVFGFQPFDRTFTRGPRAFQNGIGRGPNGFGLFDRVVTTTVFPAKNPGEVGTRMKKNPFLWMEGLSFEFLSFSGGGGLGAVSKRGGPNVLLVVTRGEENKPVWAGIRDLRGGPLWGGAGNPPTRVGGRSP